MQKSLIKTQYDAEICCPACGHKFNSAECAKVSKPLRLIDNLGIVTVCFVGFSQTGWCHWDGAPTTVAPGQEAAWVDVPAENFDFGALADGVSVLSGAAGHPEVGEGIEIFKAVTGLAKLFFEFGGENAPRDNEGQISTSWRNDNGQWVPTTRNLPQNITGATATELADTYGYSDFDMSIHEVKHWHKESWLCDKYTVTGYVSSDHPFSADVVTGITQEPYYTRKQAQ